ncbi:MAG: symbB [Patescibacteria group bacterium]|jgi:DNA-binding beta-propeller fold protein YncE|nr:symbB [Patescibacteria group bacterium]
MKKITTLFRKHTHDRAMTRSLWYRKWHTKTVGETLLARISPRSLHHIPAHLPVHVGTATTAFAVAAKLALSAYIAVALPFFGISSAYAAAQTWTSSADWETWSHTDTSTDILPGSVTLRGTGQSGYVVLKTELMPSERYQMSGIVDPSDGKAYLFGGEQADGGAPDFGRSGQIVEHNPVTNSISAHATALPSVRRNTASVWNAGTDTAYVFGGENAGGHLDQILEFDPSDGSLATKTGTLTDPVEGSAAVWNPNTDTAFIIGGALGGGVYSDKIMEYDPDTDAVTDRSTALPATMERPSAVWNTTTNTIFIFHGTSIYEYNPATESLTTKTTVLPAGVGKGTAVWNPLTGTTFIFGGYNSGQLSSIYEYDFTAGTLTAKTETIPGGFWQGAAVWNSQTATFFLYGSGGNGSSFYDEIHEYDPAGKLEVTATLSLSDALISTDISPDGTFAYVTSTAANTVRRIRTSDNTVTATISVTGAMAVRISPDGTFAYVTSSGSSNVYRIRTSDNTVTATITASGSATTTFFPGATNIDFSPDGTFAYAGAVTGELSRIRTSDDVVEATISIPHTNFALGINDIDIAPSGTFAYVAIDGVVYRVTVADGSMSKVTANSPGSTGYVNVEIAPDSSFAYLSNSTIYESLTRMDTSNNATTDTTWNYPGGYRPIKFGSTSSQIYTSRPDNNAFSIVKTSNREIRGVVTPASNVRFIAVAPDESFFYLQGQTAGSLYRVERSLHTAYVPSGQATFTYTPQGGQTNTWGTATPTSNLPANTTLSLEYSQNGSSWTSTLASVPASETLYVKASLATSNSAVTPSLGALQISYDPVVVGIEDISPDGGESFLIGTGTGSVSQVPISWTSGGGDHIHLQYSTNSGSSWTDISGATSLSAVTQSYNWTPPAGMKSTTVRVKAILEDASNGSLDEVSSAADFTVHSNVTPTVSLDAPLDSASVTAGSVQFTADIADTDTEDTNTADFQLATDSGFNTIVDSVTAQSVTMGSGSGEFSHSFSLNPVSTTTYYWRVRTTDGHGAVSAWATTRTFTITVADPNQDPAASGLGPAGYIDGSRKNDDTPSLTFSLTDPDLSDTVRYQIQIDTSTAFDDIIVDFTSGLQAQGDAAFQVGQAAGSGTYAVGSQGQTLPDGPYYWRVKVIDENGGQSAWVRP